LKTGNSELLESSGFDKDYVSLTEDAAEYLVEKGIRFVALDYLSVDEFDTSIYPVHRILMNAGVVIVEGVDLNEVPAGDYEMLCLPLKLEGCDGAPARVILRTL
jgi:arylformamidase